VNELVVVAGGPGPVPADVARRLPAGATVVAADSGLDHALALGLTVEAVVGDMDSVSAEALAEAEAAGVPVERHPVAKDRTDLELGLDRAVARGASRTTVVVSGGGRLDHLLVVAGVLAAPAYAAMAVDGWLGDTFVAVVRPDAPVRVRGRVGETLTLLPVHGPVRGVTLSGAAYPLDAEDLAAGTGRGVSNRFVADDVRIDLEGGVLLAVLPDALLHRSVGSPARR
jgi:thiamine pyrophosphokinase